MTHDHATTPCPGHDWSTEKLSPLGATTHTPTVHMPGPDGVHRVDWPNGLPAEHDNVLMSVELFLDCIRILNSQHTPTPTTPPTPAAEPPTPTSEQRYRALCATVCQALGLVETEVGHIGLDPGFADAEVIRHGRLQRIRIYPTDLPPTPLPTPPAATPDQHDDNRAGPDTPDQIDYF